MTRPGVSGGRDGGGWVRVRKHACPAHRVPGGAAEGAGGAGAAAGDVEQAAGGVAPIAADDARPGCAPSGLNSGHDATGGAST